ncbi:MAG: nitrilase-related carbon-nitrogen hydrolase [Fusobacterium sp.]|nr:nitrilase-related carbon-nitrogen hydrolase [Fusobacterium sp.]
MRVHIEQMKAVLGDTEKNLLRMLEGIDKAISNGDDLIVFPELCLNGYVLEELVFESAIREVPAILLEKSQEISIIFGAVEMGEEDYPYNTLFYLEDGKVIAKHRKVYLADYGMFYEGRYFKNGDKIRAFDTKFGRVAMLQGEDIKHQSVQLILSQDRAKYIFVSAAVPTTLGITKHSISSEWRELLKTNSYLNGVYTVMANRVGVEDGVTFFGNSMLVAPDGEVIEEAKFMKEDSLSCELTERRLRATRIANPIFKNENLDLTMRELKRIAEEKNN